MEIKVNDTVSGFLDKISALLFVKHEAFYKEYWHKLNVKIEKEYFQVLAELKVIKKNYGEFLNFYFGSFRQYEDVVNGNIFCVATTFFRISDLYDEKFCDIIQILKESPDEKIRMNIAESLLYLEGQSSADEMMYAENQEEFFLLLKKLSITSESKWNLFEVIKQPRTYIQSFCETLLKINDELDKALSKLSSHKKKWIIQLNKMEKDIPIHIIETIKGKQYLDNCDVYMYPVLNPFTAIITKKQNVVYLGLGYSTDKFFLSQNDERVDKMINILKLLSDKSKFKILMLLKNKKLYANEIAEILQLSNATISHHMRILAVHDLVHTVRIQNKTYYYLDEHTIYLLLNDLQLSLVINDD
ncbi:ArsR/SmtB family transcription factor [Bacillus atrophaeus]|uniref:NrsE n=1 Tax=Bacillus atrophaeus (strain 1942) TaxID=720555 RepID=A0ABN3ZCJ8_BACA1|nr:winged helix-turn-helix domain-containing protein [Bacillus atrophaeus]AMR61730.1 transcriptional regulator [Bacillus subtilis subsp. globigii]ADP33530.1 NrsE [Bacillus atrophaeus 1942]AIK48498.1 bacterial regulatory, arsR family protein [Bacillus atrophaeus subsp. globigii]EIM12628.1 NrsE protein [Bacillus atrophaeus C89]KFK84163.1 bacterial regulatory, arsR family protein [Bacillus atrophaeus]